ncbi:MAG: hypothetical protein EOO16_09770 [Chitinophagaceae bacterium]|nr:MAG: hypothetical protein EOO16_09770 [Chitinophagaceae bacterium]
MESPLRQHFRTLALVLSGIVLIACIGISHRQRRQADAAGYKKAAGATPRHSAGAPPAGIDTR